MMLAVVLALGFGAPPSDRTELIWSYADARLSRQIDQWFTDGDFPRSIQGLREQWAYSPRSYEVATNLGWMLENVRQDDAAIEIYQEYRRNVPDDPDGLLPEAMLQNSRQRPARVIEILAPFVATLDVNGTRPDGGKPHPNVFRLLAKAYERTGSPEKAIATWELQLRAYPGDAPAQTNIRRVRAKTAAGAR